MNARHNYRVGGAMSGGRRGGGSRLFSTVTPNRVPTKFGPLDHSRGIASPKPVPGPRQNLGNVVKLDPDNREVAARQIHRKIVEHESIGAVFNPNRDSGVEQYAAHGSECPEAGNPCGFFVGPKAIDQIQRVAALGLVSIGNELGQIPFSRPINGFAVALHPFPDTSKRVGGRHGDFAVLIQSDIEKQIASLRDTFAERIEKLLCGTIMFSPRVAP